MSLSKAERDLNKEILMSIGFLTQSVKSAWHAALQQLTQELPHHNFYLPVIEAGFIRKELRLIWR